jgi:hypothetical protein
MCLPGQRPSLLTARWPWSSPTTSLYPAPSHRALVLVTVQQDIPESPGPGQGMPMPCKERRGGAGSNGYLELCVACLAPSYLPFSGSDKRSWGWLREELKQALLLLSLTKIREVSAILPPRAEHGSMLETFCQV